MHILLTNDDGIHAPGIRALHRELKKIARVTVVAPHMQRSSIGHAITLADPLWVKKVKHKNTFFGYGLSGTPADCVKFGLGVALKKKPDMVISGINCGPNDGCSVFYSGTVAGAREGALAGIPSFAISLATFVNPYFDYAARFALRLVKEMPKLKLPKGTFLNVNVPNKRASGIKGVVVTRQGMVPIHGEFKKEVDPYSRVYYWLLGKTSGIERDKQVDTYALEKNYVTMTPMQNDTTDYSALEALQRASGKICR